MNELKTFDVYKSEIENSYQLMEGRVVNDIDINKEFFIIRQNVKYKVDIIKILSYGQYFDYISAGMSASIKCSCDIIICENDVIYEVV